MNADRRKPSRGLPLRLLHAETDRSASAVLAALVDELEAAFTPEERAAFADLPVHQDPIFGVLAKYLGPGATLDIGQVARVLGYTVGDTSDTEGDALAKCDPGGIAQPMRVDVEALIGAQPSNARSVDHAEQPVISADSSMTPERGRLAVDSLPQPGIKPPRPGTEKRAVAKRNRLSHPATDSPLASPSQGDATVFFRPSTPKTTPQTHGQRP